MKTQKKTVVARKATKMPTVSKKRKALLEKAVPDIRKEKKSKKQEKQDDSKRKTDGEKKKLEKSEEKKKHEEKKKMEEKKKEKCEKIDDKKKNLKENEKKIDKIEEKKIEKTEDKVDNEDQSHDNSEKKKLQKVEEKTKIEKQPVDNKKKIDKLEEKKKTAKPDEETVEEVKELENTENKDALEEKIDVVNLAAKKKNKEEKKKETKLVKCEIKDGSKTPVLKEKKIDRKKMVQKDTASTKTLPAKTKKDSRVKQQKKGIARKTILAKKSHLSVVKKLVDKKMKLVKSVKEEEEASLSDEDETIKKTKKKSTIPKSKVAQEKKPKLAKHMKVKLPRKKNKLSSTLKKDDRLKTLAEKVVVKKKFELKDTEKAFNECKKFTTKDEPCSTLETSSIKSEVDEDKGQEKNKEEVQCKLTDAKKSIKNASKTGKKLTKKTAKAIKVQIESNNQRSSSSEEVSSEEAIKQSKSNEDNSKTIVSSKEEEVSEENVLQIDLKVETLNRENVAPSPQCDSDDEDSSPNETKKKERSSSPSDERTRRMRLFGFWSGPKRHRVASLNALAKVHCLYENETGGVYLGGFCKPKPEKEKPKKKEEKEEPPRKEKEKEKKSDNKSEDSIPKRKLRNVPGLRGKHWDMMESSSSSSSSSEEEEECEREKSVEHTKKRVIKRRRRNEEVMDLKDMVVCKRMASLNASAILAASYSDEKNQSRGSSSSSESSSDSEVEIIRRRRQNDSDLDKRKARQGSDPDDVMKPSKKVVILNQDTDVTITGVYVNQTRSTQGFCSIAGMQYRISSTSHTQTAATAVATELHDQQKPEQPCKSYTPLGALSSMQPPGSQGNHPNMSPRRHSAFSAPHQHGYYQPAGPLIQHPPTLPPVKGPPPEPTPTPPQNSEGSDDLVATSTTSGGTSSTGGGGFYRAYCPQYYGTPPQYQDLCYPPTYSHPHAHPPPYYKYAPAYRRQYYGYQESGGGGGPGGGGTGGGPGVVDYQPPPPPPGEYSLPPYYGGYPPPPPPPPPPPNPAYLHSQGRPFVDHAAFQGCPCPMQSCPKNVDTGPLIGNGKGAPVVSGPGLSLPPSALVGPPSPARGLAGLAPPHGANAWDTDRVQLNAHRNLNQNQPSVPPSHNLVGGHNRPQNTDCRSKDEKNCAEEKLRKCGCQKHACTSTCEVKLETLSPTEKLPVTSCPGGGKYNGFKLENNNVKCESCSVEIGDNLACATNCNVKCESDYKCDIMKCEQCLKERQMAILEIDKDSGILLIDDKLDTDTDVKEELNDVVVVIDNENWKKPDYEPTVQETVDEKEEETTAGNQIVEEEQPKCQKVTKRKLSLDSLSDSRKKRKVSKRTLSVGSLTANDQTKIITTPSLPIESLNSEADDVTEGTPCVPKKKQTKKESQKRKAEGSAPCEGAPKKLKASKTSNAITNCCLKFAASDASIDETIDNVIQQSLQMTQKKDKKGKSCVEKKKKPNLLSTMKKVAKKVDLVKELATEKISKIIAKGSKGKDTKDAKDVKEAKAKAKIQEAKVAKSKGKAKESKVHDVKTKQDLKSKQQDSKVKQLDSKVKQLDSKPKQLQESKVKEKKSENVVKNKVIEETKRPALIKKRRKSTKKLAGKKANCKTEDSPVGTESLSLTRKTFLKPKWSNGWSWEGEPFEARVYLTNDELAVRRCYSSMKHESGDVLRPRDCVLLRSGPRKADLPFVAKIAALWENPDDGEMMFSLLWYYRPEHTEQGRTQYDTEDEVFASRHRDANSVACIEDKCYILTFNEYCRYRKSLRRIEEGLESPGLIVPPGDQVYPRESRQPPIPVSSDMVLFCRRVYDYRGKKLVKNPG